MRRVYFDNAATTPLAPEVIEAMTAAMTATFGNPSSIHAEGRQARALIEEARKTVARCLNAGIGEIFFTSGGTESSNMALKCAVRDLGIQRIITSPIEHHCVTHTAGHIQRTGEAEVAWLKVNPLGRPDPEDLEKALKISGKRTLVSLMHANNELGTLLDLAAVGELCTRYGALFHTDTVQTMGYFPLDVSKLKIAFLTGSAHKFHGPKGVGFIYINHEHLLHPFIDGGGQERNMRGGTENVPGIAGLAKALELAVAGMEHHRTYITLLRDFMQERLLETVPEIEFNGDPNGESHYKILSASFPPSLRSELLVLNLDIAGISASGGSACASGAEKGSHVLEGIGADPERKTIRFSFSHYNTREEVDFAMEKIQALI